MEHYTNINNYFFLPLSPFFACIGLPIIQGCVEQLHRIESWTWHQEDLGLSHVSDTY